MKRRIIIILLSVFLYLLIVNLVPYFYNKQFLHVVQLSPSLKIEEFRYKKMYPYGCYREAAGSFFIPFPVFTSGPLARKLYFGNELVFEGGPYADFFASPDEKFVLIEKGLKTEPFVILNLEGSTSIIIPDPGTIDDHYNVYPFDKPKWLEDSSKIIVEVNGFSVLGKNESFHWRQEWSIDPNMGETKMLDENRW